MPILALFLGARVGCHEFSSLLILAERILTKPTSLPGRLLPRSFYEDRPERVAPRLLGKLLVHQTRAGLLAGRIVEAEAYLGPHNDPPDPAAHSHRGPTPRNLVLFGHAGYAYVYIIYGRYSCMNVSCETRGQAGGVLIRALEPVAGQKQMARNRGLVWDGAAAPAGPARLACQLTSGPGRLCQAMGILRTSHNGLDLTDPQSRFQIRDDGFALSEALVTPASASTRPTKRSIGPFVSSFPGTPACPAPEV